MCCRMRAMADWVLYESRAGRFKSSTKNTIFADPGGPYELPDFFCRLEIMLDCRTEALPVKRAMIRRKGQRFEVWGIKT